MKIIKSVPGCALIIVPGFWLPLFGWADIANAFESRADETTLTESHHTSRFIADQSISESGLLAETSDQPHTTRLDTNKQQADDQSIDASENTDGSESSESGDQRDETPAPNDQDDASELEDQDNEDDPTEQDSENGTAEDESDDEADEDDTTQEEDGESDSAPPVNDLESVPSIDDSDPIPVDNTPTQPDGTDIDDQLRTADPELGILILREREPSISKPQQDIPVFLSGKLSFFDTENAFSGLDPVDDQFWQFNASISATPTLGPRTLLVAEAEGTLVRYNSLTALNYNELSLQTSLWHVFASGFYGEVGWQNRQLFSEGDGDRFLDEHSLQTRLFYRAQLADDLRLDAYYQLRASFTTPKSRSRLLNRLVASLTYQLTPDVDVGLIYLLSYTDYTQIQRQDLTNQISAQISYEFSPRNKISLFSGYSFGSSTDSSINFDNFIFGATLNVGVRLF